MDTRGVSQLEFKIEDGVTLLSTTDVSGNIVYANAKFVEVSGYAFDELEHQPHNIVRHPDMPSEAFADMWQTLKAGQAWTALIKNRQKNGNFYWVRANAAPMRRNGKVVGYLSVRTKPAFLEVRSVESLYQRFKSRRAAGLAFHRGLIVRTGLLRWMSSLQLMPTSARIRLPLFSGGRRVDCCFAFSGRF